MSSCFKRLQKKRNRPNYSIFSRLSNRCGVNGAGAAFQLDDGMLDGAAVLERALRSDLAEDAAEVGLRFEAGGVGNLGDGERGGAQHGHRGANAFEVDVRREPTA